MHRIDYPTSRPALCSAEGNYAMCFDASVSPGTSQDVPHDQAVQHTERPSWQYLNYLQACAAAVPVLPDAPSW